MKTIRFACFFMALAATLSAVTIPSVSWDASVTGYATSYLDGSGLINSLLSYTDSDIHTHSAFGAAGSQVGYGYVLGAADYGLLRGVAQVFSRAVSGAGGGVGQGVLTLGFNDSLVVESSTLSAGSPVLLRFLFSLDETFSSDTPDTYANCVNTTGHTGCGETLAEFQGQTIFHKLQGPFGPTSEEFFVNAVVGEQIYFSGSLRVSASDGGGGGYTTVNALSSAHFYIDVLTEGASYSTASGARYTSSAAVPEPSTAALLSLGVVLILLSCRKNRKLERRPQ